MSDITFEVAYINNSLLYIDSSLYSLIKEYCLIHGILFEDGFFIKYEYNKFRNGVTIHNEILFTDLYDTMNEILSNIRLMKPFSCLVVHNV